MKFDGRIHVLDVETGAGIGPVAGNNVVEPFIDGLVVAAEIVDDIDTLVVEGGYGISGEQRGALLVKGHQGIDKGCTVANVAPVLVDKLADKFRAVGKHGLPYSVRADRVCLAPVDRGVVIILRLV